MYFIDLNDPRMPNPDAPLQFSERHAAGSIEDAAKALAGIVRTKRLVRPHMLSNGWDCWVQRV